MNLIAILVGTLIAGVGSVWIAATLSFGVLARYTQHMLSLAAGALLSTAFIRLLPEGFESGVEVHVLSATLLAGLLFFFLLDKAELWHHGHEHHPSLPTLDEAMVDADVMHEHVHLHPALQALGQQPDEGRGQQRARRQAEHVLGVTRQHAKGQGGGDPHAAHAGNQGADQDCNQIHSYSRPSGNRQRLKTSKKAASRAACSSNQRSVGLAKRNPTFVPITQRAPGNCLSGFRSSTQPSRTAAYETKRSNGRGAGQASDRRGRGLPGHWRCPWRGGRRNNAQRVETGGVLHLVKPPRAP